MIWIVVVAALIPVAHFFASLAFKKKYNRVNQEFARLDELYKKRGDLIILFVSAVRLHFKNDLPLVTEITRIRVKAASPFLSEEQKIEVDRKVSTILENVFTTAQNYPDVLKSPQFLDVKSRLEELEADLILSRKSYDAAAAEFNEAVSTFPTNIIASLMNLKPKVLFSIKNKKS